MTDSAHRSGSPVVEGPIPGTAATQFAPYDLSELGYIEEEYFVSGQAQAYASLSEGKGDREWLLSPVDRSEYRTRFVVRRPLDPSRFNGTLIVEWLNVSGGTDVEPDWALMHRHIIREGFAWVGASVQKAGIDGGGLIEGQNHIKVLDPDRYGTLNHPGDAHAYDMFSQIGRIFRDKSKGGPLGPLVAARLIACGHSQSAAFLVTYLNAVDPIAAVYDGYLVHGRGATASNLDGFRPGRPTGENRPTVTPVLIREDVRVPVLTLQSETDVCLLGGGQARQSDSERIRLWEVAGSAHAESYLLVASRADTGALAPEELAAMLDPTAGLARFPTPAPIASGPQQHYVSHAALASLDRWVRGGTPPPEAARLECTDDGAGLVLGPNGIAVGGIRTPWVDVPVATLSGLGQDGGGEGMTFLFGTTKPFSAADLAKLYPGGLEFYLTRFGDSLDAAVERGFLLEADAPEIQALAAASFPTY